MTNLLKKYIVPIFICLIIFGLQSFANGGPSEWNGIVEGQNIKFVDIKDIDLTSELLSIDIKEEFINVEVEYKLVNTGQEREIEYSFPIRLWTFLWQEFDEIYLKDVKMIDGDKELDYVVSKEIVKNDEDDEKEANYFYNSKLHFKKNEIKTLNISYSIKPYYILNQSEGFLLSSSSNSKFYYDFTPAIHWGDRKVDAFKLKVNYKDIIEKCEDFQINMPGFTYNEQGIYDLEILDLNFDKYNKLQIEYDMKKYNYYNHIRKNTLNSNVINSITSTSTLPDEGEYTYAVKNLFDQDLATAWVEGKEDLGIGESIEIEFKSHTNIGEIAIANGYTTNNSCYKNNGKIKKLKIDIYDTDDAGKERCISKIVELDNRNVIPEIGDFTQISNLYKYYDMFDFLSVFDEKRVYTNRIVLTILEAESGNKYKDVCISEILLLGSKSTSEKYGESYDNIDEFNSNDELNKSDNKSQFNNKQKNQSDIEVSDSNDSSDTSNRDLMNNKTLILPILISGSIIILLLVIVYILKKKRV
ncbi:NADase-type glycan-binding domain-containing protein [Vallitalea guaymasensis]|uniref:NAD glycohydrolase translocation F5/8 type C domain-containing protein n=1 Tax=Vallitalea guaymasensis TaxID=1185412 RepID=A0A8J8SC24_9FIRM|nr:hypothetical protein [Vallitalea guaymasensis]QUH29244.1 hypothetical protein HYG85_10025 [Vallitalea guaymasensis]